MDLKPALSARRAVIGSYVAGNSRKPRFISARSCVVMRGMGIRSLSLFGGIAQACGLCFIDDAIGRNRDSINIACALDRDLAVAHVARDVLYFTLLRRTMTARTRGNVQIYRVARNVHGFQAFQNALVRAAGIEHILACRPGLTAGSPPGRLLCAARADLQDSAVLREYSY